MNQEFLNTASAEEIALAIGSRLPHQDNEEAKHWNNRSMRCLRVVVGALCYLRDMQGIEIGITSIYDALTPHGLESLYHRACSRQWEDGSWQQSSVELVELIKLIQWLPGSNAEKPVPLDDLTREKYSDFAMGALHCVKTIIDEAIAANTSVQAAN